ncbi:hypothetical protein Taro_009399 [Colocasia esculenta]|uniref:Uncharacterized protein n=1 Tax=Colocasia esculenta TaxID=4460 RepID=A0A843U080_COLES|nr:hypothetical protein [Colocasia esculenta]
MPLAGGGGVIRRSSVAFCSALPVLLSVSFLLLSYRCAVHLAAARIAAVLDADPDVRSLLSRLSSAPSSPSAPAAADHPHRPSDHHHYGPGYPARHRRRPPFLHQTRVGILDDDFSDVDHAAVDHSFGSGHQVWPPNSSFLMSPGRLLRLGGVRKNSQGIPGDGKIRVLHPSVSPILFVFPDYGGGDVDVQKQEAGAEIEIRIFGHGYNLVRGDAMVLAYLMTLFSVVYFFAIVGFLACYSCATGVVFLTVADFLLGKQRPFVNTVSAGSRLGFRRVLVFVFLRWAARDAVAQFLCILFFSNVGNQQAVLKLFVRVKLIPFLMTATPLSQWAPGEEGGLWWFLFMWGLLERLVALVFVFSCWVAITDHNERRRGPEVVWKGFRLVSMMMSRAIILRHVEMIVCWNEARGVLEAVGGPFFAAAVQSTAEGAVGPEEEDIAGLDLSAPPPVSEDLRVAMEQVEEAFQGQELVLVDNGSLTKGEVLDILTKVENFMEAWASEIVRLIGVSDEDMDKGLNSILLPIKRW